jgi:phosphoketolase
MIFAFHGYPWLIHRLTYRRTGHRNLHVRGYKEEGTTTTPFDMVRNDMLNDLDRFHLVPWTSSTGCRRGPDRDPRLALVRRVRVARCPADR